MRAASDLYLPPIQQVLAVLGLSDADLQSEKVTIPTEALVRLLGEVLRHVEVDEAWYLERYPDVHGAILSGDVKSAQTHFRLAGYREGRLPRELPFDAIFYFEKYKDLADAFERTDVAGLRHHYETRGFYEGRAGKPEHFLDAERWRLNLEGRN